MTKKTQAFLSALLAEPDKELYGLEIYERTGLMPGTTSRSSFDCRPQGWCAPAGKTLTPPTPIGHVAATTSSPTSGSLLHQRSWPR